VPFARVAGPLPPGRTQGASAGRLMAVAPVEVEIGRPGGSRRLWAF